MSAGKNRPTKHSLQTLFRIPALQLGMNGGAPPSRREFLLDAREEVLFGFVGSEHALRNLVTPWAERARLNRERIYLRTRNGVFLVLRHRSLRRLTSLLRDVPFVPANQGIIVNLRCCRSLDRPGRLLGMGAGPQAGSGAEEWIHCSRRDFKRIEGLLL